MFTSPAPLGGMRLPHSGFPWTALYGVGFSEVVSLHSGSFAQDPLKVIFAEQIEDLCHGGPPHDKNHAKELIYQTVNAHFHSIGEDRGIVVHCVGGRGQTGTVLACVPRNLGLSADKAVSFLTEFTKPGTNQVGLSQHGRNVWFESGTQPTMSCRMNVNGATIADRNARRRGHRR